MAEIYLTHPRHGDKVACTEAEAKHDREHGWEDFNPSDRSAAAEAPAEKQTVPSFLGGATSDIPENFPARDLLLAGGITTWADLITKTADDLTAIKNIGPATAREILEKLNS